MLSKMDREFAQAYFIQTRQEIDTEKRERSQMLNFVVVVLGAIGYGIVQKDATLTLLKDPQALAVEIPALLVITALFWVRHRRLQQVADRWFALRNMLDDLIVKGKDQSGKMLEDVVCDGLLAGRYNLENALLHLAFCLPLYGLLALQIAAGLSKGQNWGIWLASLTFFLNVVISLVFLYQRPNSTLSSERPRNRKWWIFDVI